MKKLLALLLAMLLLATTVALVSCDDDGETDGQGSVNDEEVTEEELEDLFSNILGSDFSDLYNGGGYELPEDEF